MSATKKNEAQDAAAAVHEIERHLKIIDTLARQHNLPYMAGVMDWPHKKTLSRGFCSTREGLVLLSVLAHDCEQHSPDGAEGGSHVKH